MVDNINNPKICNSSKEYKCTPAIIKKLRNSIWDYGDKSVGNNDGIVNKEDFASDVLWHRVSQFANQKWNDVKDEIKNFVKLLQKNNLITVNSDGSISSKFDNSLQEWKYDAEGNVIGGTTKDNQKWTRTTYEDGSYADTYDNGWTYKYDANNKYIGGSSPLYGDYDIQYFDDNSYEFKYENGSFEKFDSNNERTDYQLITINPNTKIKTIVTPNSIKKYNDNDDEIYSVVVDNKKVTVKETSYDENGDKVVKSKHDADYNYDYITSPRSPWEKADIYDKKTNLLKKTNYIIGEEVDYTTQYEYNSQGQKVKAFSSGGLLGQEKIRDKKYLVYEQSDYFNPDTGKIMKREVTDYLTYSAVLEYDEEGNVVNTTINNNISNEYNINGNSASEGIDRQIKEIIVSSELSEEIVYKELKDLGEKLGFKVSVVKASGNWIEDVGIKRADGKMLVIPNSVTSMINKEYMKQQDGDNYNRRSNVSTMMQGCAANHAEPFLKAVSEKDRVYSKSYLEGGNVLNTCLKDGSPSAIVGDESVSMTLIALGLEQTEENIKIAKKQIAQDLGIKEENVTFIPQFDFHIDMLYRPLSNGEIAVPDFEEAINILKNTKIESMEETEKNELIDKLEKLNEKTMEIRKEAEERLSASGYKIVKIPCFTDKSNSKINFMNGVGGTTENGEKYFMTNKSNYPELNDIITTYFQQAGIDSVYFISTSNLLFNDGGLDCITKEEAMSLK